MGHLGFTDIAKVTLKAGDGGDGAVAFHREKYVASGGPDGGDGGKGGSIIFKVSPHLSTLEDFRYRRKYIAERGENGKGDRRSGKNGADLIVEVPLGTIVRETETGRILADMSDDQPVVICKGGRGGWGNQHFATPTRQVPRFAKPGTPGEQYEVTLELKLLADVGLVGFPNVGKSSLISVVSAAKPAIANYHFTTLTPTLGVVRVAEEKSFVMADIPGLIEGASDGAGLGHQFLRHVERCRLLVHLVDISGSEGRDPYEDFRIINEELVRFNPKLAERPMLVVGNKIDLATDEQQEEFAAFCKENGYEYFPMMAAIRVGADPLLERIAALLDTLPPIERFEPDPIPELDEEELKGNKFTVRREDDVYFVEGEWLVQVMRSINFSDYESLQYFERVLEQSGIITALREAGIQEKDTVNIYDVEFDFVN